MKYERGIQCNGTTPTESRFRYPVYCKFQAYDIRHFTWRPGNNDKISLLLGSFGGGAHADGPGPKYATDATHYSVNSICWIVITVLSSNFENEMAKDFHKSLRCHVKQFYLVGKCVVGESCVPCRNSFVVDIRGQGVISTSMDRSAPSNSSVNFLGRDELETVHHSLGKFNKCVTHQQFHSFNKIIASSDGEEARRISSETGYVKAWMKMPKWQYEIVTKPACDGVSQGREL